MQFYALVAEWPDEYVAYFRELPGCVCSAPTYQELLAILPIGVADYFKWLKANGLPFIEEFDGVIDIVEKERIALKEEEGGPRFEADLASPSDAEIDTALNIAATARAAILELYEELSSEQQNLRLSPDDWSLTEHLQHLYKAEARYISRLEEQPDGDIPIPTDLTMAFFDKAMDYELLLRALTPTQRQRVFTHDDGTEWTAAKVLRRMTGHLREHNAWMERIKQEM